MDKVRDLPFYRLPGKNSRLLKSTFQNCKYRWMSLFVILLSCNTWDKEKYILKKLIFPVSKKTRKLDKGWNRLNTLFFWCKFDVKQILPNIYIFLGNVLRNFACWLITWLCYRWLANSKVPFHTGWDCVIFSFFNLCWLAKNHQTWLLAGIFIFWKPC